MFMARRELASTVFARYLQLAHVPVVQDVVTWGWVGDQIDDQYNDDIYRNKNICACDCQYYQSAEQGDDYYNNPYWCDNYCGNRCDGARRNIGYACGTFERLRSHVSTCSSTLGHISPCLHDFGDSCLIGSLESCAWILPCRWDPFPTFRLQ